ncbi:stage II sporulation protein R [Paenibacillus sp. D2_2]|uniref:stage II sporulation protein R n=1 Tax=Paenibacillus sp. D2_2 TaxID=3073092 RepID=UPI002814CBD6|nr:stage II sporulation protein R [Paenibacillus sp. D2_2]WMT40718.1 stage II sporulation protein R [Paenibacillus sp. D2_2]
MGKVRKSIALIFFSILILFMSWEGQKVDTAAADGLIPQESIRLRILANSDGVGDQAVKRKVRDAVVEQMNAWVGELEDPQSLEEARGVIRTHLTEIGDQVKQTLADNGEEYSYKVELGVVPFPTKMYGGAVYPAGNYEALRITLGEGKGKNWWCVLFPPLCFVDAGSGDALAKDRAKSTEKDASTSSDTAKNPKAKVKTASATVDPSDEPQQVQPEKTEVRFFLWDALVNLWHGILSLF